MAKFTGAGGVGVSVAKWNWNLGDGSTTVLQVTNKQYAAPGTYEVDNLISNELFIQLQQPFPFQIKTLGEAV